MAWVMRWRMPVVTRTLSCGALKKVPASPAPGPGGHRRSTRMEESPMNSMSNRGYPARTPTHRPAGLTSGSKLTTTADDESAREKEGREVGRGGEVAVGRERVANREEVIWRRGGRERPIGRRVRVRELGRNGNAAACGAREIRTWKKKKLRWMNFSGPGRRYVASQLSSTSPSNRMARYGRSKGQWPLIKRKRMINCFLPPYKYVLLTIKKIIQVYYSTSTVLLYFYSQHVISTAQPEHT